MRAVIQDLVRHKAWANALLLRAVGAHEAAAADPELRTLLHHIIVADRFWFALIHGATFAVEKESQVPESLSGIVSLFQDAHTREIAWIATIGDSDLVATVATPYIADQRFSVAQAITQVCLHSHGHRAQCASRLRAVGGTPPAMDYVLWLNGEPSPTWA